MYNTFKLKGLLKNNKKWRHLSKQSIIFLHIMNSNSFLKPFLKKIIGYAMLIND